MTTGNRIFDHYMQQSYLDNMMRGGKPLIFPGKDKKNRFTIFFQESMVTKREIIISSLSNLPIIHKGMAILEI